MYGIVAALLAVSWFKDNKKTRAALMKGMKSVEGLLPQLIVVLVLISAGLAVLEPEMISRWIGPASGPFGVAAAAVIGSITLIPGFVAFPLAGQLLENGAGVLQIAAFVSTLMMVGVATLPVEIGYFGRKTTILRNVSALVFSIAAALFVWWVSLW